MNWVWRSLTYTDSVRKTLKNLSFRIHVFWKLTKLFFKRNRKLKEKTLYFSNKIVFDKSIFTLSYNFENALYYEIKGFHKSVNGQSIDLYNSQIRQPLELIIHGFREKKVYSLTYKVTEKIESEKFTVRFLRHFKIEKLNPKLHLISNNLKLNPKRIIPKILTKQIKNTNLSYAPTPFNLKEFI